MSATTRIHHLVGQGVAAKRDLRNFSKSVVRGRAKLKLSQSALAKQVGISNKQLSNIECGASWPSMSVALRICRLLSIELPKALDRED